MDRPVDDHTRPVFIALPEMDHDAMDIDVEDARGVKRTATDAGLASQNSRKIQVSLMSFCDFKFHLNSDLMHRLWIPMW